MSQKEPDELQHLARAILIMLVPFEHAHSLPARILNRSACREYWNPFGGVDKLCEDLRRLFAIKYATSDNGSPYKFPKELDDLLTELGKLPSRAKTTVSDSALSKLLESSSVSETLRRLGDSRYNQDYQTS